MSNWAKRVWISKVPSNFSRKIHSNHMIDFEFYQLSNNYNYQLNIVNSFAIKLLSPPLSLKRRNSLFLPKLTIKCHLSDCPLARLVSSRSSDCHPWKARAKCTICQLVFANRWQHLVAIKLIAVQALNCVNIKLDCTFNHRGHWVWFWIDILQDIGHVRILIKSVRQTNGSQL